MTTTTQLREYLESHGIDGAPIEPGWHAARFLGGEVGIVFSDGRGEIAGAGAAATSWLVVAGREMTIAAGERAARGGFFHASVIASHAPLTLAPPAGRDLDAEVVAGVQAGRDGLRGLAGKVET